MATKKHLAAAAALVAAVATVAGSAAADVPARSAPAHQIAFASRAERKALRAPAGVRSLRIRYVAHNGAVRHAVVLLPASWAALRRPLPLIISPHGRGLDGSDNARLWGELPALGGFAVVNPDGEGRRLGAMSWGAPGQIEDLARMPAIVRNALPWLEIDETRVYAVGGSMGGQETLLLVARHPELLAGAAAIDSVADFALQYHNFPRLACEEQCREQVGSLGKFLQGLARREIGGAPEQTPARYAERSPITAAKAIAESGVPLQIWWSYADEIVVDSPLQSGRLVRMLRTLGTRAALEEFSGDWIHTSVMRADRQLPLIVERFGLLPERWGKVPKLHLRITQPVTA